MLRSPIFALLTGCGAESADPAPTPPPTEWSFAAPVDEPPPPLDVDTLGAALERGLARLAHTDPMAADPAVQALAERLESCGAVGETLDDETLWYRFWFGTACAEGGVDGFAQEVVQAFDPEYDGFAGTYAYTFWTADAWSGDLHVWGDATWGLQDVGWEDGSRYAYSWFDGNLRTHEQPDAAPLTFYRSRSEDAKGQVVVALDGALALDDPDADAVNVTALTLDGACTSVGGTVSIHAKGGDWYDLLPTGATDGCRICGDVADTSGTILGSTCIDASPLLAGDRR